MEELEQVMEALRCLRVRPQQGEYDLHLLVLSELEAQGLTAEHEARLAPGCRVDVLCRNVAIEIKRGKPDPAALIRQLSRYAGCPEVKSLIALTERSVSLPKSLQGKPVRCLCLNRLWGIAL